MIWEDRWRQTRSIFIFSDIDNNQAAGAIQQMYGLAAESLAPIHLWINTPGGHIRHATAIIETINLCPAQVYTIGLGQVYSAGLLVFIAGKKRLAYPNTMFMAHRMNLSDNTAQYDDALGRHENQEWTQRWLIDHFLRYSTIRNPREIRKYFLGAEHYFDEHRAMVYGMVDEILTPPFHLIEPGPAETLNA